LRRTVVGPSGTKAAATKLTGHLLSRRIAVSDYIQKLVEAQMHAEYARLEEQALAFVAMGYDVSELVIIHNVDTDEVNVFPRV
jgi:hypothetical protein